MGSLSSTPKVPQSPVVQAPVVTQTTTEGQSTQPDAQSRAEQESQEREKSLLARGRGRLGTIATSFQGFLREADNTAARKTLLGE
ncbi:MAG: hypothetical protein ACTHOO_05010 [Alcanivorax sp.]